MVGGDEYPDDNKKRKRKARGVISPFTELYCLFAYLGKREKKGEEGEGEKRRRVGRKRKERKSKETRDAGITCAIFIESQLPR